MKNPNLIESVLLSNPIHRGMIEFLLLIGTGILGLFFDSRMFHFPLDYDRIEGRGVFDSEIW